ncbi:hypothetical protein LCL85_12455 [Vibrio alginolyticus]|nr:hypothetical protein [Vibrio alginolyticus]
MKNSVISLTFLAAAFLAHADDNDNFVLEKNATYTGTPTKVHVKTNSNGGLVLDGQNASGTPLTIQHVKDGNQKGVERHPILLVKDKHNKEALEEVLPSIEVVPANNQTVSLTLGKDKDSWSFIVTKDNQLVLRQISKAGNRTDYRFFRVAGQEFCDESLINANYEDVQDIAGTDYNYSFGTKNVVRSCHDAMNGDTSIEIVE